MVSIASQDPCNVYSDCASCTSAHFHNSLFKFEVWNPFQDVQKKLPFSLHWPFRRPTCEWCPTQQQGGTCVSKSKIIEDCSVDTAIPYEFDCPLGPEPYPDYPLPAFLPDWMGVLVNETDAGFTMTLVDLCLPGTHDTLSYDLSLTVSDDGIDNLDKLAAFLHTISGGTVKLLPGDLEEFSRLQAKTQQLTITQQLDNGVRFIDCRMMMEKEGHTWRSLHFMQSKKTIDAYWQEIRDWLDNHPQEIAVIWMSKHGSTGDTGDDQYPGVTLEEKTEIWSRYKRIFDGMLLNARESSIHRSSLSELLERNHRVITYATDYEQFTNRSDLALDARMIQNFFLLDGVLDLKTSTKAYHRYFENAKDNNIQRRVAGGFTLMSMNTAGPTWQLEEAAKLRFLPLISSPKHCAKKMNLPGVKTWCPETLLDIVQLSSYYAQVQLEEVWQSLNTSNPRAFPMAFYLDGLDVNGTIRTGTQLLDGLKRDLDDEHKSTGYAYVDTVIGYNVMKACGHSHARQSSCHDLLETIRRRRDMNPLKTWDEPNFGRHVINMSSQTNNLLPTVSCATT